MSALLLAGMIGGLTACKLPVIVEEEAVVEAKEPTKFDLPAHEFIYVGMTEAQLERLVGKPGNVQEIVDMIRDFKRNVRIVDDWRYQYVLSR